MSQEKSHQESTFESCPNEPEIAYFMVPRSFIRNNKISPDCRWFITYLMSHSQNFKLSMPWVMKTQKIKKHTMYRMIDEAIEHGYLKREIYAEKGWKRYKYLLSISGKFKESLRCPDFQDTDFQDTEKQHSSEESQSPSENKGKQSTKVDREKKEAAPSPSALSHFHTYNNLKLEKELLKRLVNLYGEQIVDEKIEALDIYSRTNPSKFENYGCHASVVESWILKDQKTYDDLPKTSQNDLDLIKKVEKLCAQQIGKDIATGHDYIEFIRLRESHYKVNEPGFREKVECGLRKIGTAPMILNAIFR